MKPEEIVERKLKAVAAAMKSRIPKLIGNELLNMTMENFKRQGFQGDSFQPWKKRKKNSKRAEGAALLIKSGRGRRGFRVSRADAEAVVVSNDVVYMKAHNDGSTALVTVKEHSRNKYSKEKVGTGKLTKKGVERTKTVSTVKGVGTVKEHTRRMRLPRRQMIGKSQYMVNRLKRVTGTELMKAFNNA